MSKKHIATKRFIQKIKTIHGLKYDYSLTHYKNSRTKIKIICKHHGVFEQTPNNHLKGQGCPLCVIDKHTHNKSIVINKANKIHNNKYDYSLVNYINSHTKITIICPEHGAFLQRPSDHIQGKGCPKCCSSKGEFTIEKYLKEHNIQFENQKTFPDCKNKRVLPFDFYLPNQNILIEYDGQQHYKSIKYFGGDKSLKQTQCNDNIKTEYCQENNIKLIRIPYTEFDNIESILKEKI